MRETKFTRTDIGVFPEDWKIRTIGETACVTTGAQNTQDKEDDGLYPFYVRSQKVERINKFLYDTKGVVTAGDGVGTGKVFHYVNGKFGLHQRCYLIYNFKEELNCKYFFWVFSQRFFERVQSMTAKSSVDSVRRDMITEMQIPIPPTIAEQERIAEALSNVDGLLLELEELIAKKRAIKQGAMQELLTGKRRLEGFGGEWEEKKLGKIGFTFNGLTGKTSADFGVGQARYITFLNVLNNPVIDTTIFEKVDVKPMEKQNAVQKNDLFFNTSSETPEEVGTCSVLLDDVSNVYLNSFCFGYRLTDDSVSGLYLAYYFRCKLGRELMITLAQGSTRYNLSKDQFLKSTVFLPNNKAEQEAISNILSDMDKEILALESKRAKYEQLKQGMMQELLTGRIRLV